MAVYSSDLGGNHYFHFLRITQMIEYRDTDGMT